MPKKALQTMAASAAEGSSSLKPEAGAPKADSSCRMLAVTQFFEADDMAYVLDRMLSRAHSMHSRLESGRYFVRYVRSRTRLSASTFVMR